jgi:hypothetical protein
VAAKRQTVIALTAGAGIAVALGILGILHATAFDPELVRVEAQSRLDQLNRIPESDPLAREALAKEILANELYREHAKVVLGKVERMHLKIREAANLERAAMKEVPPFLAKCKDLRRVPHAELDALHGEAGSLLRNYGTTRYGEELKRLVQELKVRCESIIRCTANDVVALSIEVEKLTKEGRFVRGYGLVDEFEKKYVNAQEFESQLREIRQKALRKAESALPGPGSLTTPDARQKALQRLEGPDFKGLPLPALDAAVRELKRR